jgi:hypothetical protein
MSINRERSSHSPASVPRDVNDIAVPEDVSVRYTVEKQQQRVRAGVNTTSVPSFIFDLTMGSASVKFLRRIGVGGYFRPKAVG